MKIIFLTVGPTTTGFVKQGIDEYAGRLKHYVGFEIVAVGDVRNTRNMSRDQQKQAEGKAILSMLDKADRVVLLDERGTQWRSVDFAARLQQRMASGLRRLVFVVGGPYGFSTQVYDRADAMMSLSKMTLPHELVRLVFVEQFYRAMTILHHEPYHHE